jgi:hypothetical protein
MTGWRAYRPGLLDDPGYQKLPPHARLVLLIYHGCQERTVAGIFIRYVEQFIERTGLSPDEFAAMENQLEAEGWIRRDHRTLWVVKALALDPAWKPEGPKANPNLVVRVLAVLRDLPPSPLVDAFCDYYALPREGARGGAFSNRAEPNRGDPMGSRSRGAALTAAPRPTPF